MSAHVHATAAKQHKSLCTNHMIFPYFLKTLKEFFGEHVCFFRLYVAFFYLKFLFQKATLLLAKDRADSPMNFSPDTLLCQMSQLMNTIGMGALRIAAVSSALYLLEVSS